MSSKTSIHLTYHRFTIRVTPSEEIRLTGWIGAILRNNFLYAAEQVIFPETGQTLRKQIGTLPLKESHPLYNKFKNGFPAPYILCPESHAHTLRPVKRIAKGEILTFSLCIIGNAIAQYEYFLEAIRNMCRKGIGTPRTTLLLIDMCETHPDGKTNLILTGETCTNTPLQYPVSFNTYSTRNKHQKETLRLEFITPTNLYKTSEKINLQSAYQDKMNGFPSFYQLIRSAAYRLLHLSILYQYPEQEQWIEEGEKALERIVEAATSPTLCAASLKHIPLPNTLKKEEINRINLSGFVGTMSYEGKFGQFLPLLLFMRHLGIGHDVVYGLGRYGVKIEDMKKRRMYD